MARLLIAGDRLGIRIKATRRAYAQRDLDYILKTAGAEIHAGAEYLNVNVGAFDEDADTMRWAVEHIQRAYDDVPLLINSENAAVIEAGLQVYRRTRSKPVINSADAGARADFINIAADYNAKIICQCQKQEVPISDTERVAYCSDMLERGMALGINPNDMYFDAVTMPIKENQERQLAVLQAITQITKLGLRTVCGVTTVSVGLPREVKPVMESAFTLMAMQNGLSAAILNPCSPRLMQNIFAGEAILNHVLFSQQAFIKLSQEPE